MTSAPHVISAELASVSHPPSPRPAEIGATTFPILVAVAADDVTTSTVRLAEELAAERGAAPTLLYVMELAPIATLDGGIGVEMLTQTLLDPAVRVHDEALLRQTCRVDTGVSAAWPFIVDIGDAASSIVVQARKMGAQLIVMGLRHHNAVGRALGTDTLRDVLSLGGMPVLAVRPELTALPQSIVVAIDFSRASVRAARLARRLLADDGTMHLVFVASTAADATAESEEGQHLIETQGIEMTFAQVRNMLDPGPRMKIVSVTRRGDPVAELKAVCEEIQPELVAIGSQRHPFLERLLIGSVTKAIAGDGRWSVLVTPPTAAHH